VILKINKSHLELVFDSDTTIKFGKYGWVGEPVEKIWYLAWKADKNPYSNDENSQSRFIGYISFTDNTSYISYSYLKTQYRGQGIGHKMYRDIAKKEGFLSTNLNCTSADATRLWEKLSKQFTTRKLYLEDKAQGYRIYP
jgi:ribosomal protein S18 acetylase RimI-like enzyme